MSAGSTALLDPEVERPDLSGDGFVVSRSAEAERLTAFILSHKTRIVVLSGPQASGKTVLLTRWVVPTLRTAAGPLGYTIAYGKCTRATPETFSVDGRDISFDDLLSRKSIVVVDEFDRTFELSREERRAHLDSLFARLERANPEAILVAVVSEQNLTSMYALSSYDPRIVNAVCEIKPVGLSDGLEQLARQDVADGVSYDPAVLEKLRQESLELERRGIDVTFDLLKLLHARFCREAKATGVRQIQASDYEKIGGLIGVVREHVSLCLDKLEAEQDGADGIARAILERVLESNRRGTPATFTDMAPRFEVAQDVVDKIVAALTAPDGLLFRSGRDQYQFQPPQVVAVIEEEQQLRQIQNERAARIIEEGLRSRQQLGTFLPQARFAEIHRQRWRLVVDDEMSRFLLQCALRDEGPGSAAAEYWLRRISSTDDAMDVLLTAAFDASPAVRERVAWLLGDFPDSIVRERLGVLALTDSSEAVRYGAVESLSKMADDELLDRLLQEVNKQGSPYRVAALEALRIFPRPEVAKVLQAIVGDSTSDATMRNKAVDVLAMLNIDQSVDALIDIALNDSDREDREAAARALSITASEPLNHRILDQLDWRRPTRSIVLAAVLLSLGLVLGMAIAGFWMVAFVFAKREVLILALVALAIVTGLLLRRMRDGEIRWRSPLGFVAIGLYALCAITVLPLVHGLAHIMVKRYRRGFALMGLEALGLFMYAVLSGATEFVPIPGLGFLAQLYRVTGVVLMVGTYFYDVLATAFRTILFRKAMTREERRANIHRETFANPVMADAVFADLGGADRKKASRAKRLVRKYGGAMLPSKLLQLLKAPGGSHRPYVVWALAAAKDSATIETLERLSRGAKRRQQIAIGAVLGEKPTVESIAALRRIGEKSGIMFRALAAVATLRFRLSVWPWSARLAALALVPAAGVLLYHGAMIRRNPAWSEIITLRQPLPSLTQKSKIVNFLADAYPRESADQLRGLFRERRTQPMDSLHAALVRGLVLIHDATGGDDDKDTELHDELAAEAPKFGVLLRGDSAEFILGLRVLRAMAQSRDTIFGPIAEHVLIQHVNEDTSFAGNTLWRKQAILRVLGAEPWDRALPALDNLLKTRVSDRVQSKNPGAVQFADLIRDQIVQTAKQASVSISARNATMERRRFFDVLNRLDAASPELGALKRDVSQTVAASGCDRNADGVCDEADEDALRAIAENPSVEDGYRDLLSHYALGKEFQQAVDTFEVLKRRYPSSVWPGKILSEMYHETRAVTDPAAFARAYDELRAVRQLPAYAELKTKSPGDYVRIESDYAEVALTANRLPEAERVARDLLASFPTTVDRLNMSLFIYLAAVMQHDVAGANARLADLDTVIRGLPSNHYNNWVYPGTRAFIDGSDLAPPVKDAIKKFFQEGQWYSSTQSAAVVAQNREALKALEKS
jgi:hypothetical protein